LEHDASEIPLGGALVAEMGRSMLRPYEEKFAPAANPQIADRIHAERHDMEDRSLRYKSGGLGALGESGRFVSAGAPAGGDGNAEDAEIDAELAAVLIPVA